MSRQRPKSVTSNISDGDISTLITDQPAWRVKTDRSVELEFIFNSPVNFTTISVGYYNCNELQCYIKYGADYEPISDTIVLQNAADSRIRKNKSGVRQIIVPDKSGQKSDRVKLVISQQEKSRAAGNFGLDLLEFYGTGNVEIPEETPVIAPPPKPEAKFFWKKFKQDVDKFCVEMGLDDFDALPSLTRGGFFIDAFEASRGDRNVTDDELGCFTERVHIKWAEILSQKPGKVNQPVIPITIPSSSGSDHVTLSSDDDVVEMVHTPAKKRKLSHRQENENELRFTREPDAESAQCPLCRKYFDVDYIFQHSSTCSNNEYITQAEEREIKADDLSNRRYVSRRRINPVTGREEVVRQVKYLC
mgnify:CR=1 FL=1